MNKTQSQILTFLDDKKYVSGESIAQKLGISRAAVSKNIKALKDNYQINVYSNPKVGYLLEEKLDLIKVDELTKVFENVNYFYSINSTSKYAIEHQNNFCNNEIFISEFQTDGFGRFNRKWVSPFGKNIYCTLLEVIELDISKLNGLSLVVAMSIAKILKRLDLDAKLKWPNDIFINDKKIAGVIINISAEVNDRAKLFIGCGINVNMQYNQEISKKWTSIKLESQKHANRTNLLIQLIKAIRKDLTIFIQEGFCYFKQEFEKFNYLKNKQFSLKLADKNFDNCKYLGLSQRGEIIIENQQGSQSFSSGDISILANSIKSK
ncbi:MULTISPECIES: biotin--[acetyl-CoA-carboxylase] ligase [Francisella]|uniref:Bifunctional ligase/repressor BirA n=1 Tax=Francisella opportunistica TaxID=2016517 RepID=A0A345JRA3_9GAMM|nr:MULTISPECIES: biotin--[acetyl-CoA-carboxylase] ligase [Francisella]APC91572.1 Biotin-protein ligase / Biotin operon repressor [Francisella sp. MA067296]AXH29849.1 biotin--[acetyl-CoA-carboxylase] ligase [Francisella opportunistica]AXH31497.1 biotin--[acetyl-CoA-carboxylase] ligase [Francisella opportunistica]AXH33144.1 biotin--[acetyl-CoA-carboxylase] ligase [Francisella opportunistica]